LPFLNDAARHQAEGQPPHAKRFSWLAWGASEGPDEVISKLEAGRITDIDALRAPISTRQALTVLAARQDRSNLETASRAC
jgi:hypothetical protein